MKKLIYLAFLISGIGIGYLLFHRSEQPDNAERDRLKKENNELLIERQQIMDNLLSLTEGLEKEMEEQSKEHKAELQEIKKSHNEKRTNIRRLSADSILNLFAEDTRN